MLKKIENAKGFTLIELMVVVAIIGIILAVAVPYYIQYKKGACDTQAGSDLQNLITAINKLDSELEECNILNINAGTNASGWARAEIYSLAGYYGWGGNSQKCDVQFSVNTGDVTATAGGTITMVANRGTGKTYSYTIVTGKKSSGTITVPQTWGAGATPGNGYMTKQADSVWCQ